MASTLAAQADEQRQAALDDLEAVRSELAKARAALDSAPDAAAPEATPDPTAEPAPAADPPATEGVRRRTVPVSPEDVLRALALAPGLDGVGEIEREELRRALTDQVCAPDALLQVFGQVNRQTLVSLIRTLGRC